jgi:hypothetical protein
MLCHTEYTQVKKYPGPTFTDQGLEVPVEGNFVMRWRTTCHLEIAGQIRSFPCEGYGLAEGEQPPLFGAKKVCQTLQSLLFYTNQPSGTVQSENIG